MALKGAGVYLSASAVAPAAAMLRNIVIARFLGPDMFGLGVTLIMTAQFFDIVTDTGADKFVVQDKDGDTPQLMANAHSALIIRGIVSALAMVALAMPLAHFYNQPQLAWPLAALALVPLSGGFLHLDLRRFQRARNLAPEGRAIIFAELSSLIIAIVTAVLLRNFYAALYSLLARTLILTIMSHVVAERPYRVAYDRNIAKGLWKFGWPLTLNGGFLFIGSQGDRVLVAHMLGVGELGRYSTALLLVFYPATIVHRFLSNVHFPAIAASREKPKDLQQAEYGLQGQLLLVGIVMALGFAIAGPTALTHLYGRAYQLAAPLVAMIGLLQVVRSIRYWPTTVALAIGRTGNVLTGNLLRLVALPLAAVAVLSGGGLFALVTAFVVGEIIALAASQLLISRYLGRRWYAGQASLAVVVVTGLFTVSVAAAMGDPYDDRLWIATAASGLLLAGVAYTNHSIRMAAEFGLATIRKKMLRGATA